MKQSLLNILYKILANASNRYINRTKPIVIGITGSVGKTSCRMVLSQALSHILHDKKIYTSPKNYNTELGITFSIFQIEEYDPSIKNLLQLTLQVLWKSFFGSKKYDILIAEYGIDTPGDMDTLLKFMRPDIAVLTKLDSVHSENFPGGVSELWRDKWKLLISAKQKVYVNTQDDFSQEHLSLLSEPYEGLFSNIPSVQLGVTDDGFSQNFSYNGQQIYISLIGKENVAYTILAFNIANHLGYTPTDKNYHFSFTLIPGRFSVFHSGNNIFIDSTYNASPESMKKAIENTQLIQKNISPESKIIYVLGDMREIGDDSQDGHTSLVPSLLGASAIMLIGPEMYKYVLPELTSQGFGGDIHASLSSREVGKYLKKYLKDNTDTSFIVLFKGSQNTIFTEEALASQLTLTKQKNLPRQSESWKQKKDEFFENL